MPPLDDSRIQLLVSVYTEAANRLSQELEDLLFAPEDRKFIIYQQVLRILKDLDKVTNGWARNHIREFFLEQDKKVLSSLPLKLQDELRRDFNQINEDAVESLVDSMTETISAATKSVENLAKRVLRRQPVLSPPFTEKMRKEIAIGLAKGEGRASIIPKVREVLENRFRDGVVTLTGKGGRSRHFGLDYYAALVTHTTTRQAMTAATITRAQRNDFDLVRISPNPSLMDKCYCNIYRGKVFSISGKSEIFPYLGDTPNGGPPFHPWCRHSASIFIPELHTPEEIEEYSDVPKEFLLQEGEEDHSRILAAFRKAKEEDPTLGSLLHP